MATTEEPTKNENVDKSNNDKVSNDKSKEEEKKESSMDKIVSRIEGIKNNGNTFFKQKEYHDAINRYDIAIEEYKTFIKTDYDKTATESLKKLKAILGSTYNNRAFAYFRLEMFGQVVLDTTQAIKFKFWKVFIIIHFILFYCDFAIN